MVQPSLIKINLEQYGENGYLMYRIPGVAVTPKGTVLAWYEARTGQGDYSRQDIILRRSLDGGRTWGEREYLIAGDEEATFHNACFIVDGQRGLIHMVWHKNYNQAFYRQSEDEGLTWTEPMEITATFERFRLEYDWNVIATGPGHGLALRSGRLFFPVWLSCGGHTHRPSVVSCIYSDDGGRTWERGDIIFESDTFKMPNETASVQLADGRVLLNMRHESRVKCRAVSISADGATGWSQPVFDMSLPDPVCFGSLVRFEDGFRGGGGVLFSNCAGTGGKPFLLDGNSGGKEASDLRLRANLTVRLSRDECRSWTYAKVLERCAGYSDLGAAPDGQTIYCFYERDWAGDNHYQTQFLCMAVFHVEWLTGDEEV